MRAYILSGLSARIVKWLKHFFFPEKLFKNFKVKRTQKDKTKIQAKHIWKLHNSTYLAHCSSGHPVLVSFSLLPQANIVYTGHCCVHYVISNWGWCAQKAPGWLIWLDLIQRLLPNGDKTAAIKSNQLFIPPSVYTWTSRLCRLAMSPMQDRKLSSNVQLFLTQVLSCTAWSLIKNRMCILDLQPNLQQQK